MGVAVLCRLLKLHLHGVKPPASTGSGTSGRGTSYLQRCAAVCERLLSSTTAVARMKRRVTFLEGIVGVTAVHAVALHLLGAGFEKEAKRRASEVAAYAGMCDPRHADVPYEVLYGCVRVRRWGCWSAVSRCLLPA